MVAVLLGFQDFSQLIRDYTDKAPSYSEDHHLFLFSRYKNQHKDYLHLADSFF